MKRILIATATAGALAACGGPSPAGENSAPPATQPDTTSVQPAQAAAVDQIELHKFDCGTIEISDLDIFATDGSFAGQADTFASSCWLVRHPDGDLIWDLGLPGILVSGAPQTQGVFTVSMDTTLTAQLRERGLTPQDIELLSVSHSHFDHVGQIDQFSNARWLVHEKEFSAMFPAVDPETEGEAGSQYAAFDLLERETFSGEKDVFGDGKVVIFETPGHTPGHTSLQVMLDDLGPVLLTGDLWHRLESRAGGKVPRFNSDVEGADGDPGALTRASMQAFEARAEALDAIVIIQHEPASVEILPDILR